MKIYKSKQIKNAVETQKIEYIEIPNPSDHKFRPIAADSSCPTSRLYKIMDILLHPFLNKIKSYIRGNIDFLNYIPGKIVTFDVTSLYSNIPHEFGKEAISF